MFLPNISIQLCLLPCSFQPKSFFYLFYLYLPPREISNHLRLEDDAKRCLHVLDRIGKRMLFERYRTKEGRLLWTRMGKDTYATQYANTKSTALGFGGHRPRITKRNDGEEGGKGNQPIPSHSFGHLGMRMGRRYARKIANEMLIFLSPRMKAMIL